MVQKNLAYHCYPLAGNEQWRWNIDQLRRRLDLFDGKRVVAIVTDDQTDPPEAVQDCLPGCEWIVQTNDPQLGEAATWVPLWTRLQGQAGVTFRAHAKGVTPWEKRQSLTFEGRASNVFGKVMHTTVPTALTFTRGDSPPDRPEAMRLWADVLYQANLDRWPEALLERFPIVGALKQNHAGPAKGDCPPEVLRYYKDFWPPWQYLGSFYWVRNADFFARDWRGIAKSFYGTETWPGFNFRSDEAGCGFWETFAGTMPLEKLEYLRGVILPALAEWKRAVA